MNPYDKAYELAESLRSSSQFAELGKIREKIEADEQSLRMLQDFRKRQWELQTRQWMGQSIEAAEQEQFEKLAEVVTLNRDVSKYLELENHFQRLIMDINEIVGRVVSEVSLDPPLPDTETQE